MGPLDKDVVRTDALTATSDGLALEVHQHWYRSLPLSCVERLEVARLKFVEDLPEKEIAARQGLTRDGVAGQLKRIRKGLRDAFGDSE